MRNAIEAAAAFVVSADNMPRGQLRVGGFKHEIASLGIVIPSSIRLDIHGAQLPLPHRIADTFQEALFLFLLPDLEPNFDQNDSAVDNVTLDLGTAFQESLMLLTRDEAHDILDPSAIIPAAIEDNDFASRGETFKVALKE